MNELIKLNEQTINNETVQTVMLVNFMRFWKANKTFQRGLRIALSSMVLLKIKTLSSSTKKWSFQKQVRWVLTTTSSLIWQKNSQWEDRQQWNDM